MKKLKLEYFVVVIAWMFWAVADGLSMNFYNSSSQVSAIVVLKSVHLLITTLYSFGLIALLLYIQRKSKSKTLKIIAFPIGVIFIAIITSITVNSSSQYMGHNPVHLPGLKELILYTIFKIIYYTGFITLFFMIRKNRELMTEKNKTLAAQNMATNAQLQLLQQQVNPHFLFNTLNSLRSLIVQNPTKARTMVTDISEFLRESLQSENTNNIPLSQEIEILKNYLSIQKIRFEEDLEFELNIDKLLLSAKVPPFILQPLAENAIKHGLKSNVKLYVTININTSNEYAVFEVINNGSLQNGNAGYGNINITKRLELLYADDAIFKLYENNGNVYSEIKIKLSKL